jgi:hypothetical protein
MKSKSRPLRGGRPAKSTACTTCPTRLIGPGPLATPGFLANLSRAETGGILCELLRMEQGSSVHGGVARCRVPPGWSHRVSQTLCIFPSARFLRYEHEVAYLLAKGDVQPPAQPIPDVIEFRYTGNELHPTQGRRESAPVEPSNRPAAASLGRYGFSKSGLTGRISRSCGASC